MKTIEVKNGRFILPEDIDYPITIRYPFKTERISKRYKGVIFMSLIKNINTEVKENIQSSRQGNIGIGLKNIPIPPNVKTLGVSYENMS